MVCVRYRVETGASSWWVLSAVVCSVMFHPMPVRKWCAAPSKCTSPWHRRRAWRDRYWRIATAAIRRLVVVDTTMAPYSALLRMNQSGTVWPLMLPTPLNHARATAAARRASGQCPPLAQWRCPRAPCWLLRGCRICAEARCFWPFNRPCRPSGADVPISASIQQASPFWPSRKIEYAGVGTDLQLAAPAACAPAPSIQHGLSGATRKPRCQSTVTGVNAQMHPRVLEYFGMIHC